MDKNDASAERTKLEQVKSVKRVENLEASVINGIMPWAIKLVYLSRAFQRLLWGTKPAFNTESHTAVNYASAVIE